MGFWKTLIRDCDWIGFILRVGFGKLRGCLFFLCFLFGKRVICNCVYILSGGLENLLFATGVYCGEWGFDVLLFAIDLLFVCVVVLAFGRERRN